MSLWSKIEPLCPSLPYNESFPALIDGQKYGYFSQKAQGVSGYYQDKFLLIVLFLLKKKKDHPKKIFQAVLIRTDAPKPICEVRVFKRSKFEKYLALEVIASLKYHADLQKIHPDAIADAPVILGTKEKVDIKDRKTYLCIDTIEEKCPTTLSRRCVVKGKLPLALAINGLYKIAVALNSLHKKGIVHRDVKNWNIFVVESKLKLFDFDLARKFPHINYSVQSYEFWDHCSCDIGFIYPFCDVYGWTAVFGMIIWGAEFHTLIASDRKHPDFFKSFYELFRDKKPSNINLEFYNSAYRFIAETFIAERLAFNKIAVVYNAEYNRLPAPELAQLLHKSSVSLYPSMQKCIDFIRPWAERLSKT